MDARLDRLVDGYGPVCRQEHDPRVVLELAQEDRHQSVSVDFLSLALHEEHVGCVEEKQTTPLAGSGRVLFELFLDRLRLKPNAATSDGVKWTLGVSLTTVFTSSATLFIARSPASLSVVPS